MKVKNKQNHNDSLSLGDLVCMFVCVVFIMSHMGLNGSVISPPSLVKKARHFSCGTG